MTPALHDDCSYFNDVVVDSPDNARFLIGQRTFKDELTLLPRSCRIRQSLDELILHSLRCSQHPVTAASMDVLLSHIYVDEKCVLYVPLLLCCYVYWCAFVLCLILIKITYLLTDLLIL